MGHRHVTRVAERGGIFEKCEHHDGEYVKENESLRNICNQILITQLRILFYAKLKREENRHTAEKSLNSRNDKVGAKIGRFDEKSIEN